MMNRIVLLAALLAPVYTVQSQENAAVTSAARLDVAPVWETFAPRYQTHICPFHGDVKFDEDVIECGSVLVPEDRTNPNSRLIRLAVMQVKSSSDNPPGGTVVRLEGGPGGSAISGQRAQYYSGPEAGKLRAVANYVFLDQRGVGYSEPAFCRAVPQNYQYGEAMGGKGKALYSAAMRRCYDEARAQGIQIDGYSNWQNALDVRDVRRALGHEQWTIFGISYGTQLGQGVMRVDPEGTRAAILDSVVPAAVSWSSPNAMAANFRTSLDSLANACRSQTACAKDYPDLRARFYDVIRTYGKKPLVIDDVSQSISMTGRLVADDTAVANLLFQLLYNRGFYQDLPVLLDALENRRVDALRAYVEAGAPPLDHSYGGGMHNAIVCRSGHLDPAAGLGEDPEIAETAKWFGIGSKGYTRALCDSIDPASPDATASPLISDIPTLVLAGDADPITPASYSRSIMSGLSRATYVEFPLTGHAAAFSNDDCGEAILTAFIADPEATPDIACAKETEAPTFLTSWRATPKAFHFLTSVQEGARPIFPIVVILGLVFALFAFPVAAIGRRLDRRRGLDRKAWRMPRLTSWGGALLALGGLALAGKLIMDWSANHMLAVPLGLPDSIAYAGLLTLAGSLVASYAAIRAWAGRKGGTMPVGTLAGAMIVAISALAALGFLFSIGSGPFLI
jgi:pimeloyl-ACP methyl ester carboxylesterase